MKHRDKVIGRLLQRSMFGHLHLPLLFLIW